MSPFNVTETSIHVHVQLVILKLRILYMYMLRIFQAAAIPLAQFYSHNKTCINLTNSWFNGYFIMRNYTLSDNLHV